MALIYLVLSLLMEHMFDIMASGAASTAAVKSYLGTEMTAYDAI